MVEMAIDFKLHHQSAHSSLHAAEPPMTTTAKATISSTPSPRRQQWQGSPGLHPAFQDRSKGEDLDITHFILIPMASISLLSAVTSSTELRLDWDM
jgi:hypothetical protein